MSDAPATPNARIPNVYFIDDSATMREVIKIAFRKENIHVLTCPDAASALAQFAETTPDAVITDVIMPDKDGYDVCEFVKQHEQFAKTPVILMSGVVNRAVAERAMAVRADELIRKPFQPPDLIARVKKLLNPRETAVVRDEWNPSAPSAAQATSNPLSGLFATAAPPAQPLDAAILSSRSASQAVPLARTVQGQRAAGVSAPEVQRLRNEIRRLELLVKKLQSELEAQREYCTALEAHLKTLQEVD